MLQTSVFFFFNGLVVHSIFLLLQSPLTEGDIIAHLPDKRTTMDIMLVTRLLSERGTNALGDFEIPYSYDPLTMAALERYILTFFSSGPSTAQPLNSLSHVGLLSNIPISSLLQCRDFIVYAISVSIELA